MARLLITLQYLLPHHLLCRLAFALTRVRTVWLKNLLIGVFTRCYRPHLEEALDPDPRRYADFNAFFTRALKPGARPINDDPSCISAPCDGLISTAGRLQAGELLQAKGHPYSLQALLAGDPHWTRQLRDGLYVTVYLAPSDYHRVHMPLAGRLRAAWHVPGRLFSVNTRAAARVPGLFARNERVICVFDAECGPFAIVMVGALFVGSISTVWHGQITPRAGARASSGIHQLEPIGGVDLWQARGAELGRFNMGSTVLLLLPPGTTCWQSSCEPGASVKVGQPLGRLTMIVPAQ